MKSSGKASRHLPKKMVLKSCCRLLTLYSACFNAVEQVPRHFAGERALVAAAALCIFDAAARWLPWLRATDPNYESMTLAQCLWEDGGYSVAFTVCRSQRPLRRGRGLGPLRSR